jgi:predicted MFS family arabinose efflux permease
MRSNTKVDTPSAGLIVLLAATAGLVVMNLYYNQPILNAIAATFKVGSAAVAWVATATQLGYAAALLFVVPLGDAINRKWLIIASSRPQHYGPDIAGMFGLLAITGAMVGPLAGHLGEKWKPRQVNGLFLSLILLAFIIMLFSQQNALLLVGIGVLMLDAGAQGSHIANQARIYSLDPALHGRINSLYMVTFFLGGSIGSLLGSQAWAFAGWPGVCATGMLFSIAALVFLWI